MVPVASVDFGLGVVSGAVGVCWLHLAQRVAATASEASAATYCASPPQASPLPHRVINSIDMIHFRAKTHDCSPGFAACIGVLAAAGCAAWGGRGNGDALQVGESHT